jgi:hypothetical protein
MDRGDMLIGNGKLGKLVGFKGCKFKVKFILLCKNIFTTKTPKHKV